MPSAFGKRHCTYLHLPSSYWLQFSNYLVPSLVFQYHSDCKQRGVANINIHVHVVHIASHLTLSLSAVPAVHSPARDPASFGSPPGTPAPMN